MTNITEPRAHISLVGAGQVIKPKKWTRLIVATEDQFTLIRGDCDIDLHVYADFGTANATWPFEDRPQTWQTMIRRLDGTPLGNPSSRDPQPVPKIYNFARRFVVNGFQVDPNIPLTFDVWMDAKRDVTLREVVLKLHITRAE